MTRKKDKKCIICKKLCYGKLCRPCRSKNKYRGLARMNRK